MTPLKDVRSSVLAENCSRSDVLLLALTRGLARWEPVNQAGGMICCDGVCHFTKYNAFGVPAPSREVTQMLLDKIAGSQAEVK